VGRALLSSDDFIDIISKKGRRRFPSVLLLVGVELREP
jgi:hypothetical protein